MINENDYNWDKIKVGADKYAFLMIRFQNNDVSIDELFQTKFTGFYRVRRNREKFLKKYFSYLQSLKSAPNTSFRDIITYVKTFIGTVEPSFSSKLLATINPNFPVWDQYVLSNIGIAVPVRKSIDFCVYIYQCIINWYNSFMRSGSAAEMVALFDKNLPEYKHFTTTKKIDLMLWQKR